MFASSHQKKAALKHAVGALIFVDKDTFLDIVQRDSSVLVVIAEPTMLTKRYQYMCGHKGMTFIVQNKEKFEIPANTNLLHVSSIQVPFSPVAEKESLIIIIVLFVVIICIPLLLSFFNAG